MLYWQYLSERLLFVLKWNRGYIVSTVMSFVLDVCRPLLSALYTYILLGKLANVHQWGLIFRLYYNKSFVRNKIYLLGSLSLNPPKKKQGIFQFHHTPTIQVFGTLQTNMPPKLYISIDPKLVILIMQPTQN